MTHRIARPLLLALAGAALLVAPAAAQVVPRDGSMRPPVDVAGAGVTSGPEVRAQSQGEPLVGTFRLAQGTCSAEGADGSYFRMTQPAGQPINNGDSPCDDQSYTPLAPGTDGGLVTASYQPHPDPAFDSNGNGVNDALTQPARFFGVDFSTATNPTDPQTGTDVSAPEVTAASDGSLAGDLRAFAAAWNGQHFNQGAPKPDGERPEGTEGPTGTYDAASGAFELEWSSRISGGPFNGFTGTWHFEGTFESSQPADDNGGDVAATSTGGAPPATSAAAGPTAASPATSAAAASATASQPSHPRTGSNAGTTLAGAALLGAFTVASRLRRRAAVHS